MRRARGRRSGQRELDPAGGAHHRRRGVRRAGNTSCVALIVWDPLSIRCRHQAPHQSARGSIPIRGTASLAPRYGPSSSSSHGIGWILRPGTRFGWCVAGGGWDGRRPASPASASAAEGAQARDREKARQGVDRADRGRRYQRHQRVDCWQAACGKRGGVLNPLGAPSPAPKPTRAPARRQVRVQPYAATSRAASRQACPCCPL